MGKGCFGGFFGNDEILWFIILFLLLFCGCGFGPNVYGGNIGCKD